ncbi:MAG TPA: cysteine synthase family protein [Pyrinomonadaceae bacterium]|nr:cysteine synthase family protein [Pyrinomonadaceae bacterium]
MQVDVLEAPRKAIEPGTVEANIGNTPLLKLRLLDAELREGVQVFAKAEHLNPGGSVKDRAALSMIIEGERSGKLKPGMTILDATSGNTGIAYAMIGASRGYTVKVCLPKNASLPRKRILRSYGVEIVETDPMLLTDGSQLVAREIFTNDPDKYFYPDQYNNDANWLAHYDTTANEIWEQTGGRITHFVTGLGTTGTFVGVVRRLRELNPKLKAVAVQPESPLNGIEGLKHMATAIVPGIYDASLVAETLEVTTEDALLMTGKLAREEGLLVGPSSGANVFAAGLVGSSLREPAVVVTVLCDGGERYLSD